MRTPPYRVIYSSRKTLALVIEHDASVTVRSPKHVNKAQIARFVEQKQLWIRRNRKEQLLHVPPKYRFEEGEKFLFHGEWRKLRFSRLHMPMVRSETLFVPRSAMDAKQVVVAWYKKQALKELSKKAGEWARNMDLSFRGLNVTDAKRQLGSCTMRKVLNFPWRLVMAPSFVIDYIVVHELTHIAHMNHSRLFWKRVGETYPRYKKAEEWLKEHRHLLHLG